MNKRIIYLLMIAVSLVSFTACGGGNDGPVEPVDTDYAQQIAGNYAGQMKVTLSGGIELNQFQNTVSISRNDKNKINVKVNAFVMEEVPGVSASAAQGLELRGIPTRDVSVGDIVVNDIAVAKSGDNVVLSQKTVEIDLTVDGQTSKSTVSVNKGSVNGSNLTMALTVPVESVGNVTVEFAGAKQ